MLQRGPCDFLPLHTVTGGVLLLQLLFNLAEQANLKGKIEAMFQGEHLNITEDRAVLHVALRAQRNEVKPHPRPLPRPCRFAILPPSFPTRCFPHLLEAAGLQWQAWAGVRWC